MICKLEIIPWDKNWEFEQNAFLNLLREEKNLKYLYLSQRKAWYIALNISKHFLKKSWIYIHIYTHRLFFLHTNVSKTLVKKLKIGKEKNYYHW